MSDGLATDRLYWLEVMQKIADPVLAALEQRELKKIMPIETKQDSNRKEFSYLEALSRLLVGISPWLEGNSENPNEQRLLNRYRKMAREAIDAGTDPDSPDRMNFTENMQPIVDAAFLAQAIVRAPAQLWKKLDDKVKLNVIQCLKATRSRKPHFSNWLLFSAMIETALYKVGEDDWDPMRIDFALKQVEQWYLGDGMYSDGPEFRHDYYNSFVIHPMLVDVIENIGHEYEDWQRKKEAILNRAIRYAVVQERLISPEGTFPPVGRSLAYRFGAFQSLAQHSLRKELPASLKPAQVRSGLTAVIKRVVETEGTFTRDGWLTIGYCGHQSDIGENYITTGSTYLCAAVFLPLGLPDTDAFWSDPPADWTAKKAWKGYPFPIDAALKD